MNLFKRKAIHKKKIIFAENFSSYLRYIRINKIPFNQASFIPANHVHMLRGLKPESTDLIFHNQWYYSWDMYLVDETLKDLKLAGFNVDSAL